MRSCASKNIRLSAHAEVQPLSKQLDRLWGWLNGLKLFCGVNALYFLEDLAVDVVEAVTSGDHGR